MTTLKEWYDSLSPNAQYLIKNNCEWFDVEQDDYYKKVINSQPMPHLLAKILGMNVYSSDRTKSDFCLMFLNEYKKTHTEKDLQDIINILITRFVDTDRSGYPYEHLNMDIIFMSDDKDFVRQKFINTNTCKYDNKTYMKVWNALYLLDDYSDVPNALKKLPFELDGIDGVCDGLDEIIGMEATKQMCIDSPSLVTIRRGQQSELFDECFFCENGWSEDQCIRWIKDTYAHTYSHTIVQSDYQDGFRDFIERIVSVDQKYLRYMYDIIKECPALGNKVYDEKKPDDELTGNETPEMTFRYSKFIRKLARIANICARKSLSNVNGKFLKEVGPVIKFYGYNWNDIYDCIMDELENK